MSDIHRGDIVHNRKVFDDPSPAREHPGLNTHASPTPVVDAGRVFVHYGSAGTACLDAVTGEVLWERRDLPCDHRVRAGSSPIVDDERLFLVFDGVDQQYVVALDRQTGETRWRQDRAGLSDPVEVLPRVGLRGAREDRWRRSPTTAASPTRRQR